MNGKQAKRLRRQAEGETVGLPLLKYKALNHTSIWGMQFVLDACTRKRYKELKKEYANNRRN